MSRAIDLDGVPAPGQPAAPAQAPRREAAAPPAAVRPDPPLPPPRLVPAAVRVLDGLPVYESEFVPSGSAYVIGEGVGARVIVGPGTEPAILEALRPDAMRARASGRRPASPLAGFAVGADAEAALGRALADMPDRAFGAQGGTLRDRLLALMRGRKDEG